MKCKLLLRLHGKPKEKLTNGCRLYMSGNYALKHRAVCSKRSEYTECIKSVKLWVVHFYCTLMACGDGSIDVKDEIRKLQKRRR